MRTTIDIDNQLLSEAMKATDTTTKRAVVEEALRKLVAFLEHDKVVKEVFRKQEIARQAAMREGCLGEWHAELVQNGNWPRFPVNPDLTGNRDALIRRAIAARDADSPSPEAIIEEALRLAIQLKKQQGIKALRGKVRWEGNLDEMREGRFVDWQENREPKNRKSKEPAA